MKNTLGEWRKCASVTYGGKPWFFFHAKKQHWVMWDRVAEEWAVYDSQGRISAGFSTHLKAMASDGEKLSII